MMIRMFLVFLHLPCTGRLLGRLLADLLSSLTHSLAFGALNCPPERLAVVFHNN